MLLVKGENVMLGYWKNEGDKKSFKKWLAIHRRYRIFENEYLKIMTEKDILITPGGDNISLLK